MHWLNPSIRLCSRYFLARMRRHCCAIAHFLHKWATGRNGCNGRTGWMLLHRHNCTSFPHSKIFSMLKNQKVLFPVRCDQCGTKKRLFHFQSRNQSISHIREWKSTFFVPHWWRRLEMPCVSSPSCMFSEEQSVGCTEWSKKASDTVQVVRWELVRITALRRKKKWKKKNGRKKNGKKI